ncbi:chromate transporter [Sporomusa sp.]|uniref:chromate transporter n=1 Tax=Sporomusa sp. TaxID=2078658 RepID=UPI002CF4B532|nr:chromate transporter [Sporomusa sp.]HWR45626.1 chromate transporter [Sporomusa sp.]
MVDNKCRLTDLFITFSKIGAFSFGGGYAMMPVIEREVVDQKKWIGSEHIADIFTVTGCLPGAIGLNVAAFIGYKLRGIPGAIVSVCGNLLPSALIVLALSMMLLIVKSNPLFEAAFSGIRPTVVGLILCAAFRTGKTSLQSRGAKVLCVAASLVSVMVSDATIPVILAGGIIGYVSQVAMKCKSATRKENS